MKSKVTNLDEILYAYSNTNILHFPLLKRECLMVKSSDAINGPTFLTVNPGVTELELPALFLVSQGWGHAEHMQSFQAILLIDGMGRIYRLLVQQPWGSPLLSPILASLYHNLIATGLSVANLSLLQKLDRDVLESLDRKVMGYFIHLTEEHSSELEEVLTQLRPHYPDTSDMQVILYSLNRLSLAFATGKIVWEKSG